MLLYHMFSFTLRTRNFRRWEIAANQTMLFLADFKVM